jgi:hypothetical protein
MEGTTKRTRDACKNQTLPGFRRVKTTLQAVVSVACHPTALRHDSVAASIAASTSVSAVMGGALLQTLSDTCETSRVDFPVAQS